MRLSTSRELALVSNSGLSTDAWPTSASTAVPPRVAFGTVATGWHPARARTAASAATEARPRDLGERFDDPGEPDSGEATSSGASASSMRERAAQKPNPKMAARAPKIRRGPLRPRLRLTGEMRRHPDVGDRADEERGDQDPRGPVDLALEPAPGAIPAAEPVAAAADRPAEARRLGCLYQHAGHQEHREHGLRDDQRVLELSHGTGRFYPRRPA